MKKTALKLFALVSAFAVIFAFSACGKGTEAGNENEKEPPKVTQSTVTEANDTQNVTEKEVWLKYINHSYTRSKR